MTCMGCDDDVTLATWRSDDGYPFCEPCAYDIYRGECRMESLESHTLEMWRVHGRPHGPI